MLELLKQKYQDVENLRGKKLLRFLSVIFIIFILIGATIGYFKVTKLTKNEVPTPSEASNQIGTYKTYKGVVTFIGEDAYPQDKIKYMLSDTEGSDIILLRAVDAKLSIAEGLFVTVTGKLDKTIDGKEEVLQVTEVTLKNGAN